MKSKKFKTSGIRHTTWVPYRELLTKKTTNNKGPLKSLTKGFMKRNGRMRSGAISMGQRGGGEKTSYRMVDFKQMKHGVPGIVASIEYDPMRTGFIALIHYQDGEKRYIIATQDMEVGHSIMSGEQAEVKSGNRLPLSKIPVGYFVHNIELTPGKGGQIVRSAGSGAQIMAAEGGFALLLLPSKEIRKVPEGSYASIGMISNPQHNLVTIGKAGRSRHMGRRPKVRGTVMNPVDHPHGGGEGKQGIGLKYPKTPWGKPALGVRTRNRRKASSKLIIRRRQK